MKTGAEGISGYRAHSRRNTFVIVFLAVVMFFTAVATLQLDIGSISFPELLRIIFDRDNPLNDRADVILVWNLYLPRIACGILAGFGLGVAGTVMQCVLRNP
ncbi:iron chelate uptake ABC transporter family permease subunit, partial [Candidatus Methanarcanum hacksteinii]|uniref:iron chelate uptake ABC transporter family permease subunit n=1 Tax=Candidatus Methanarcanum hacksteinii TaxID=2911857 RepID=UPI0037DD6E81